jgi:hypothetical protein
MTVSRISSSIAVVVVLLPAYCGGFLLNAPGWRADSCWCCSSSRTRERANGRLYIVTDKEAAQSNNSTESSMALANAGGVTQEQQTAALTLKEKAQTLRKEVARLQIEMEDEKERILVKETENIDRWIDELLIQCTVDDSTQMIKNVDQVVEQLVAGRFSQEQVNKIFERICATGPPQSRSKLSPIVETFVDAVGKLDCMEWEENPNKRWSGGVERNLRKKLFAMDWGCRLDEDEEN